MTTLPIYQAITRFTGNEDRFNSFLNGGSEDSYTTSAGEVVPSIQNFLSNLEGSAEAAGYSRIPYATFLDGTYLFAGLLGVAGTLRPSPAGWGPVDGWVTPYLPAPPGLTLAARRDMCWSTHVADGNGSYAWVQWYDAGKAVLGSGVVPARASNETPSTTAATVTAPAGTAYCRIAGYGTVDNRSRWPDLHTDVLANEVGRTWLDTVLRPYLTGDHVVSFWGDSIAAGLGDTLGYVQDLGPGFGRLHFAVGGENVLDTSFRAGAVPIIVKGPVTLPASGSTWVEANYVFGFRAGMTTSSGAYTITGKKNTQLYSSFRTLLQGTLVGIKSHRDTGAGGSADSDGKIYVRNATGNGQEIVFNDDIELSGITSATTYARLDPRGIGVVMMGTNGGFAGINNTSPAMSETGAADRLIDLQARLAARFQSGKYILVGFYIGGFTTSAVRDYYAQEMEKRFGQKFWDMRAWLLGPARTDLSAVLTAADDATIAAGNVPSIYLADGTHPSPITYRAALNRILRRMQTLGWIETFTPLAITLPTSLTATTGAATIAVGATTPVTVAPGNSPTGGSTLYLFTTSNAGVATVSATGLVTGVASGTATITAQCRFGGAIATVGVTVA